MYDVAKTGEFLQIKNKINGGLPEFRISFVFETFETFQIKQFHNFFLQVHHVGAEKGRGLWHHRR